MLKKGDFFFFCTLSLEPTNKFNFSPYVKGWYTILFPFYKGKFKKKRPLNVNQKGNWEKRLFKRRHMSLIFAALQQYSWQINLFSTRGTIGSLNWQSTCLERQWWNAIKGISLSNEGDSCPLPFSKGWKPLKLEEILN